MSNRDTRSPAEHPKLGVNDPALLNAIAKGAAHHLALTALLLAPTALAQVEDAGEALRQLTREHLPEHAKEKDSWGMFIEILESAESALTPLREEAEAHPDWLYLGFTWDLQDPSDWEQEDQLGDLDEDAIKVLKDSAP